MTIITAYTYSSYLAVRIRSDKVADSQRPLHIGIIIDTSGSMDGERLTSVKRTLHAARSLWTPTDKCTLVGFNDTATIYQSACTMDEEGTNAFYASVDSMTAEHCTNLSAGLSALYSCSSTYDSVILLTDGVVNRGVTSLQGLQVLSGGDGTQRQVIHALGYGADHSRTLLRRLAIAGCGSYTYVDSDEILPLAIGNIIADARCEVSRDISILTSPNWVSIETSISTSTSRYLVGNIIHGRDYWCVFMGEAGGPVKCLIGDEVFETVEPEESSMDEVKEQILRARVASVLEKTANALEECLPIPHSEIDILIYEITTLPTSLRMRPLVRTFIAQLTEARATTANMPHMSARLSAATTILTTQRGVYSTTEDPTNLYSFCSPAQRTASQTVSKAYT